MQNTPPQKKTQKKKHNNNNKTNNNNNINNNNKKRERERERKRRNKRNLKNVKNACKYQWLDIIVTEKDIYFVIFTPFMLEKIKWIPLIYSISFSLHVPDCKKVKISENTNNIKMS